MPWSSPPPTPFILRLSKAPRSHWLQIIPAAKCAARWRLFLAAIPAPSRPTADTDADADYVSISAGAIANAQMNGTYVARIEIADVVAHFARIYIGTLPNNVSATAKISA
ncbi:MAG: hypothetical protein WBR26_03220 [Candidatus Acidiferrum sp.]